MIANTKYKLNDPAYFDDEYDQGFGYVITAHAEGDTNDYYACDCWVVDGNDNVHKGLNSVPAVVHEDMVIISSDTPSDFGREPETVQWRW